MYEELNAPIPDLLAYLERLGLERPENLNEAALDKIIFTHQCKIVFENLDPYFKKPVSLKTSDLFEKIITNRRGGYCFELNGLFVKFLNALGYDAYSCRCRIIRNKNFTPAVMHRGNIVNLNGSLYYCDVGFGGPQPPFCLKVEDRFEKSGLGESFCIKKADDYWWTVLKEDKDGLFKVLQFTLMPEEAADFDTLNYFCSTSPSSGFTQKIFLNRRLENGSVSLTGNTYVKTVGGIRFEKTVEDENTIKEIAKNDFNLIL